VEGNVTDPGSTTAVTGSAYGYSCDVEVFGSHSPTEPTPSVTLESDASNSPQSASVASARADAGPATIFSSGRIDVSTSGHLGPDASATSSVNIANLGVVGDDNFTASSLASTCTASESGVTGSTTITDGIVVTDNGDHDHDRVTVTLPTNPAPNTAYEGRLRIGSRIDTFRWVFNEQVVNGGSITVNAAHQYLLGPMATGELIVGRVVCGVTVQKEPPPPPSCA
jgi:hypothetical protein